MLNIEIENPDWISLRQAMALSLATGTDCTMDGADMVLNSIHNRRMFDAVSAVLNEFPGCRVTMEGSSVLLKNNGLPYGNYQFTIHPYVPLAEIILVLAPALSRCEFRSELLLEGVTHSHLSYPASFLKEALPSIIGNAGYTVASSLKKFGFYASGKGEIETKIYPYEKQEGFSLSSNHAWDIVDIRVFVSKIDLQFAEYQKQYIQDTLDPAEGVISIMEIMNAAGYGNHIDVYMNSGDITIVESMTMELYDENGEFIFSDEMMNDKLDNLCKRVQYIIDNHVIASIITREAAPFLHLAGINLNKFNNSDTMLKKTINVCNLFSG